ncbi:MAG: TlpA family protein disulfide reductase [Verrucomicrobiales bacterium]|nr:TlpA family protein disulfide reductase [Verrucomicrobiales bacterium]
MKSSLGSSLALVGGLLTGVGFHARAAVPPNDAFDHRIVLEGLSVSSTGSNAGATREAGEPYHNDVPAGASVWWSWRAPQDGFLAVSTAGSGFDTVVAVYTGDRLDSLVQVAVDDDGNPDLTSKTTFRVEANRTYQIAVDGYSEGGLVERGSIVLSLQHADGFPAPSWTLKDIDGKSVGSTNYAGQVVLINFWATWCGPCISEMPGMVNLQTAYGSRGFSIVGISVDEGGPSVVRSFLSRRNLNYQIVMSDGRVENAFGGIEFLPTSFVIDREGNLIDKLVGYTSEPDFRARILPLLGPEGAPRIAVARRASGTFVVWPAEFTGVAVESAASAIGPWAPSGLSAVVTNGQFEAEIPSGGNRGFYRLRR